MTDKTPVALFTYNRPEHARLTLEALAKCSRLSECDFYFFSDAPKTQDVGQEVESTREILQEWQPVFGAHIVSRRKNLGLAGSIVSGVSELCERYGRVIVLEDDLIVGPDFLHFMLTSLDHYENNDEVMQIGGFTVSTPENLSSDVFLLPVTTTWGWATWERAWQHFSWDPIDLSAAQYDQDWLRLFNLDGTCNFSGMLEDRLQQRNDSWGILWWYAVSRRRGLVAYPRNTLVWNGGFDGSGVHCGSSKFSDDHSISVLGQSQFPSDPVFPATVEYEPSHLRQLEEFFRNRNSGDISKKIINRVPSPFKHYLSRFIRKFHNVIKK